MSLRSYHSSDGSPRSSSASRSSASKNVELSSFRRRSSHSKQQSSRELEFKQAANPQESQFKRASRRLQGGKSAQNTLEAKPFSGGKQIPSQLRRSRRASQTVVLRQKFSKRVLVFCLAILLLVVINFVVLRLANRDDSMSLIGQIAQPEFSLQDESYSTRYGDISSADFDYQRAALVGKHSKRDLLQVFQYAKTQEVPASLLDNLKLNPETLEFVLNYPQLVNAEPPAELTAPSLVHNGIPHLLQFDMRWGAANYGDEPLALSGCGPTVVSMLVYGLTGDKTCTPYAVSQYAFQKGLYSDQGTSWDMFTWGLEHYGLKGTQIKNPTRSAIINQLKAKRPIVASMKPGDFTILGHFIILTGLDAQGNIIVNDPNSVQRTNRSWEPEVLVPQIKAAFAVTKAPAKHS